MKVLNYLFTKRFSVFDSTCVVVISYMLVSQQWTNLLVFGVSTAGISLAVGSYLKNRGENDA